MRRTCNPPRSSARRTKRTKIATVVGVACLLFAARSFAADDDPRWNIAGWTPSLAASFGVSVTDMEGFIDARDSGGTTIRAPIDTQDYAVVPMLRGALAVESPLILKRLGGIRGFVGVDYYATFPPGRNITAEGNPSSFFIRPAIFDPPEQAIEGQGSALAVRTNRLAYGATAGVVIPIKIADANIFVKPGVSWMRQQWDVHGVVRRAIKSVPFGRDFRGIELEAKGKLYTQGVGPYLAIEAQPEPLGPLLVSLFVEAAYYRTLGDQDINISNSASFAAEGILPTETYNALWGMEISDDFWRSAVGLRFFLTTDRKRSR